jgi:hypothetical protein
LDGQYSFLIYYKMKEENYMKFGVREICDVVFKATSVRTIGTKTFAIGEPVLYIDTAKTSTMEGAATTVYATGGKGNTRLLAWEGEKTLTFTVEDAMLSPLGFSVLTGAGLITSTEAAPVMKHVSVTVLAASATTVKITPASLGLNSGTTAIISDDTNAKIYGTVVDTAGAVVRSLGLGSAGGYSVIDGGEGADTDVTVTFSGAALSTGVTPVVVDFYVEMSTGAQQLEIEAGTFGGYYYVEASTLFRDQATGLDMPAELVLPLVKIQSNFTFAMAATGDPSTFSFVMDAFPGATKFDASKKVLAAIQILGTGEYGS